MFLRSASPDIVGHMLLVYLRCIGVLGLMLYFWTDSGAAGCKPGAVFDGDGVAVLSGVV